MLNRVKLLKEVQSHSDKIFYDISNELMVLENTWNAILSDNSFFERILNLKDDIIVPLITAEQAAKKIKIDPKKFDYRVFAVDGSQVYPDRHRGTLCFLINVGIVDINYCKDSKAKFETHPKIFIQDEFLNDFNVTDFVDSLREELEFQFGYEYASLNPGSLLLFDGSLMLWNLVSKDPKFQEYFVIKYLSIFEKMAREGINFSSYVSLPANKDFINLIKLKLSDFNIKNRELFKVVDQLTDIHLMSIILPPFTRTEIFKINSPMMKYLKKDLEVYSFYLNVGYEIARIEIPAFVALNKDRLDFVCNAIIDQSNKGIGYPVSLAEAHELAVVKNNDKEFFYSLIEELGLNRKSSFNRSQKSLKKIKMSI